MKQLFKKIKAWYKDNCQRPDDWENMSSHDRKVFTISAWAAFSMVMCPFLIIIVDVTSLSHIAGDSLDIPELRPRVLGIRTIRRGVRNIKYAFMND